MSKLNPFKGFQSSPEIIRLTVMMYVRFPLSLRNVEDLLHERGIDVSYETIRFWWHRFGPMFAAEIRHRRADRMRAFSNWRWHVDEVLPSPPFTPPSATTSTRNAASPARTISSSTAPPLLPNGVDSARPEISNPGANRDWFESV